MVDQPNYIPYYYLKSINNKVTDFNFVIYGKIMEKGGGYFDSKGI
ncbi:hypothetical protein BTS2_2090 [Bacillus sp. TS-2]|nr:hypothetical protein BTS2_2090 [Bacillus sp. TS-2]